MSIRFKADNFEAVAYAVGPAGPSYEGSQWVVTSNPRPIRHSLRFVGSQKEQERIEFLTDGGWKELTWGCTVYRFPESGRQATSMSLAAAISLLYSVPGVEV